MSRPEYVVQTVRGEVDAEDLGIVLPHEHLYSDFTQLYVGAPRDIRHHLADEVDLLSLQYVKQFPYSCLANLLRDRQTAEYDLVEDLKEFKAWGGCTIVENSSIGTRTPTARHDTINLSEETDVNIVLGTGYFTADFQTTSDLYLTGEQMYDRMQNDIIRYRIASFIGEVGCSWPLAEFEKKSLTAAAEVQEAIKCPVSIHPPDSGEAVFEILRLFQEAGGIAGKTVMSHLDRIFKTKESLMDFVDAYPCYYQFDQFGDEFYSCELFSHKYKLTDVERLELMLEVVNDGHLSRVLMSHDIHTKHRMREYGSHGYAYIIRNVQKIMLRRGFSKLDIESIFVDNPKNWLKSVKVP